MHITNALIKTANNKPVLFTTPGHCQEELSEQGFLNNVFKYDYSEIEGLDNLQNPQGIIKESQKWASEIYESGHTFYLVNGSSSGILALMLATTGENEKVLIARNAHKSVINALVLSGAYPIWMNTDWINEWNIPAGISLDVIKNNYEKNPDIKAVWLTNPTYEGIVTDISSIGHFCNEKGIILIVDEAHGALWNFSDELPQTAIKLGADASVQSLHKTASCLNQGAIMHLNKNSKISPQKLQQCLNLINTTSPSYIMLASIESSIGYLISEEGQNKLNCLLKNIDNLKQKLAHKDKLIFLEKTEKFLIDKTKIFFGIKNVSGMDFCDYMQENFGIEIELCNEFGILAVTGIGTNQNKLEKLLLAISNTEKYFNQIVNKFNISKNNSKKIFFKETRVIYSPREAFKKTSIQIKPEDSIGRISKETIVNYPPGIPILIQGELIYKHHIDSIKDKKYIEIID
jgi:arginine decarboxylase